MPNLTEDDRTFDRELRERFRKAFSPVAEAGAVLACSGGGDSTALGELVMDVFPEMRSRCVVAHWDHQLRPTSAEDAAWVSAWSASLGLACDVGTWHRSPGLRSNEAHARASRYQFLTEVAEKTGLPFVATAHTRNDTVETVLFRLFRGTGIKGLVGIPAQRPLTERITLVRPLLDCSRDELRRYLGIRHRTWREDETNLGVDRRRNWIRQRLMPMLTAEFNPRTDEALLRLVHQVGPISAWLDGWADAQLSELGLDALSGSMTCVGLPMAMLQRIPASQRAVLFHRMFHRLGWPLRELSAAALARLDGLVSHHGSKAIELPGSIRVERHPTALVFRRESSGKT